MLTTVRIPQMGTYSELLAAAHLMAKGLYVFKNLGPHGPVDLIALDPKTGATVQYDVKSARDGAAPSPTKAQAELGVRFIYVNPDTGRVTENQSHARLEGRSNSRGEREAQACLTH